MKGFWHHVNPFTRARNLNDSTLRGCEVPLLSHHIYNIVEQKLEVN